MVLGSSYAVMFLAAVLWLSNQIVDFLSSHVSLMTRRLVGCFRQSQDYATLPGLYFPFFLSRFVPSLLLVPVLSSLPVSNARCRWWSASLISSGCIFLSFLSVRRVPSTELVQFLLSPDRLIHVRLRRRLLPFVFRKKNVKGKALSLPVNIMEGMIPVVECCVLLYAPTTFDRYLSQSVM